MANNIDDLRQLEEKRNDIIVKLEKIEERKSHVSHEVFEKVKKEYQEKLANLDRELSSHVELVREELASIEERETSNSAEAKDLKLTLEEIELRYTIGEFDEDAYKQQKSEVTDKISALEGELDSAKRRKKWLKNIMGAKETESEVSEEAPKKEVPKKEMPKQEEVAAEISIDEHLLEKTLPEETVKLDEIIVEEEAVRPAAEAEPEAEPKAEPAAEAGPEQNTVACPKCGHQNAQDSWYCEKCGAEILDTPIQ